ncbi:MAG: hypothetical protein IRY94_15845 [Rhodospirillaceae bacterium]|nr:hypothetical protein [Rhodospirillaceae bacterium]
MPPEHPLAPDAEASTPPAQTPEPAVIREEIQQSDPEMIRVYEDLIDLLIRKNIVRLTDFPPAAQAKLLRRRQMRAMLAPFSDILSTDDGEGIP